MEFPIEIQMLINAYAKPMTRPDWREGSYVKRTWMKGVRNINEPVLLIIILNVI